MPNATSCIHDEHKAHRGTFNRKKAFCAFLWLNGECGFFGDALGLFEVASFVNYDDAIGVHEAVSDCGRDW